jgi:tRNA pseudouridine38-40 synthase
MAHYQVILAYDGTAFAGFQRQASARTVQGAIEAALRSLGWQGSTILAAGRTDTGVHASGQVISFDMDWEHSLLALCKAINANLPPDVAAQAVREAQADFHPRFSARARRYVYQIFCQEERLPFMERANWRVWPAVNLNALQAAAVWLPGDHDFTAFGTPPRPGGTTVRTVMSAGWQEFSLQPGLTGFRFEIVANAFLYHMVRRLVYLQVLVGQGRIEMQDWVSGLQNGQPQTPGLAPAHGLVLAEVYYV